MLLTFMIRGQTIRMSGPQKIIADTVNYIDAQFIFSPEWEGLSKVAYFSCNDESYSVDIHYDDRIYGGINLSEGTWKCHVTGLSVYDETVEKRITTDPIYIRVYPAADDNGSSFPVIEASYSEQILAKATNAANMANEAYEKAVNAYEKAEEALDKSESGSGINFTTGVGVTLSEDNVLSVDSAKDFDGDNTRPAEAAFMQTIVGNIETLLGTI